MVIIVADFGMSIIGVANSTSGMFTKLVQYATLNLIIKKTTKFREIKTK